MEYGILIAENYSTYQVIGTVSSMAEAHSLAIGYIASGAAHDALSPEWFVIVRRDSHGFYRLREAWAA